MVANVIRERLKHAGLDPSDINIDPLVWYVELLSKWNKHINLTALTVTPPSIDAIDRLIVEPVAAARHITTAPNAITDIGSGGGSPAIPFALQFPEARLTMVESRSKKCAFLREATRSLAMVGSSVIESRFEDVRATVVLGALADVITVRAVRLDDVAVNLIRTISRPDATVVRFTSDQAAEAHLSDVAQGLRLFSEAPLLESTRSSIQLFHVEH